MPRPFRFALALCLLWTTGAWAQRLTEAQYQKLKVDVTQTHQAEFAVDVANNDFGKIAAAYNALASPTFWVWKTSLREQDVYEATSVDGTNWDWSTFQAQTAAEKDTWNTQWHPSVVNPSLAQTRASWTKIFQGSTAPVVAQRNFLLSLSRRPARRIEALLYVTTLGDGSTATPANMSFEGTIGYEDVRIALTQTP